MGKRALFLRASSIAADVDGLNHPFCPSSLHLPMDFCVLS